MKLVALCTLPVQKVTREKNPNDRHDRPDVNRKDLQPGAVFDTRDWDISDDEAKSLIAAGAARQQTRPVEDDDDSDATARRRPDAAKPGSNAAR